MRGAYAVLVLAVVGCGHGGALQVSQVAPGVYRSGQPSERQARDLVARYGFKAVLKLDSAREAHDRWPSGVEVTAHPLALDREPDPADLAQILEDLDAAPRPVLIHCDRGDDRTGLVVGLYRVRHGAVAFAAWGEMRAFGFHEARDGLVRAWVRATGFLPEEAARP